MANDGLPPETDRLSVKISEQSGFLCERGARIPLLSTTMDSSVCLLIRLAPCGHVRFSEHVSNGHHLIYTLECDPGKRYTLALPSGK